MSEWTAIKIPSIRTDINFSQCGSMIQCGEHQYMQSQNGSSMTPHINAILNPVSIFSEQHPYSSLDDYLKIQMREKPKDTLREIQQKKKAFIAYTGEVQVQQRQSTAELLQKQRGRSSREKQQFRQFTFYRICQPNTLLFIRVLPSKSNKCNISVSNLRGEVVKYYPNALITKKEGKIIAFIERSQQSLHFVFDYTQFQNKLNSLPPLVNSAQRLYYRISEMSRLTLEDIKQINTRVQESGRGKLISHNDHLILMSNEIYSHHSQGHLQPIITQLKTIETQQQQFLSSLRGRKQKGEVNLAFDSLCLNLWRQSGKSGEDLITAIIQLFNKKESEMSGMIIPQEQSLHTHKRMLLSQNCSLCLSNNPQIKRPKRTFWICTSCSAEKEKPIYLCKGCFKKPHPDKLLYLFRKNQKKTKKTKMIAKKMLIRKRKEELRQRAEDLPPEQDQRVEVSQLLELDQKCDQFFQKFEELVQERSFRSAEYYLQMLINMTIMKSHEYLSHIDQKQTSKLKIEQS